MSKTRLHFYNNISTPNSNSVLVFLQPVDPKENYQFHAWNVLNPSFRSSQFVDLITEFSGSIASFGDSRGSYSDPVGLQLGRALGITNPNNQSPVIGGPVKDLTPEQVGLMNNTRTPPTPLSVTWFVNNKKVVETNNTLETVLRPGFTSTFQLKQSIFCIFAQKPTSTTTYTLQTFSETTEFKVPNGAEDMYIELYETPDGIASFKLTEPRVFKKYQDDERERLLAVG